MASRYDLYIERKTWLHRLDARVKFVGIALAIVVACLITGVTSIVAYFLFSCVMILMTRAPWSRVAPLVRTLMLPLTLMIVIIYPLTTPPVGAPVLLRFWIITITLPNVLTGVSMALRLDAMTFVSYTLMFTTKQKDLVRALVSFGMPFKYGLLIATSFRYLPAFDDVVRQITEAQQARGLDVSKGGLVRKARNAVPILAATMITSLKWADQLAIALVSRAFDVSPKRTYLTDLKMRPADTSFLVLSIVLFAIFVVTKYMLGVIV